MALQGALETVPAGPGPILGKFVRISGLQAAEVPTVPFARSTGDEDEWQPGQVDGQEGQCVDWEGGPDQTYIVVTFTGLLAKVPEARLEEIEPPSAEKGGFDVAWPAGAADAEAFAASVAETLADKGYCVVQTFADEPERQEALRDAQAIKHHEEYRLELEEDYLGRNNYTKAKKLKQDMPDSIPEDALSRCNHQLTELGLLLCPLAPTYLDFTAASHSKAVARLKYSSRAEEKMLGPVPLTDEDVEEGLVKNHILFLQMRQICMLYMVDNDGGEVYLYPKDGGEVMLPANKNKLLLFRHDRMTYSYKPQGESLAVQAWMLGEVPDFQLSHVEGTLANKNAILGISGPPPPDGLKPQMMSVMTRIPGDSADPLNYWSMVTWCTDCVTEWPSIRFDKDLYYSSDPNDVIFGKAYTYHGGFLQYSELTSLDHEFFNISWNEFSAMSMNSRMFCEVGYEALYRSGWTKETLNKKSIGVYIGDVGSDWHDNTKNFAMWWYDPDFSATAVHSGVCCARLSYLHGLVGPTMTFDTACSASLYATHHAHMAMLNFHQWGIESDGAVIAGTNSIGVSGHIGNCQGNILTHTGRCFTFDEAADGYQRGEGCAAAFVKFCKDQEELDNRLACIVGTVSSHDGKSASLTAPSGPAQQAMLKHGMRFGGLEPDDLCFTECHGTGTALGDPIEMGAIAAVIVEEREFPLLHTTPKSNIGHLESCAGVSGMFRLVLSLLHSCVPPNVHFRKLNPHVDMEGYPRIFQTEICEWGLNSGYAGCSSFGFGGANARCDVYARALRGPLAKATLNVEKLDFIAVPCPSCMGPMCFRCGAAVPQNAVRGPHHCSLVRDEFADYEVCSNCYKGEFRYGMAVEDLDAWTENMRVFITGTWNAHSTVEEMDADGEGGFTCVVPVGDTKVEEFFLLTNHSQQLFPSVKRSGSSARILVGGSEDAEGRKWRIDARGEKSSGILLYKVTFTWGERKTINWELLEEGDAEEVSGAGHSHRYFIVGSWKQWSEQEMQPCEEEPGVVEVTFKIGRQGKEEFYFLRDRDKTQAIHPATNNAESSSVPIRGPDDLTSKHFLIRGRKREIVTARLRVVDAHFTVTIVHEDGEKVVWEGSPEQDAARVYHLTGTFNNWGMLPMDKDADSPGIHRCQLAFNDWGPQDFQILVDGDAQQVLYPSATGAQSGEGLLQGPDNEGSGLYWQILGEPGLMLEVVLNLNILDRRRAVTWGGLPQLTNEPSKE